MSVRLTPREQECEGLMLKGLASKDIATRMGLKECSVMRMKQRVYEKRGVDGHLDLLARNLEVMAREIQRLQEEHSR